LRPPYIVDMKKDNLAIVIKKFCWALHIRLDFQSIYDELLTHPDYPSLLAVSDVLATFNVENGAYRITETEFVNVPCPFIAHTALNEGDFLLVEKIEGQTLTVSNERWNRHKLSIEEFKKTFSGLILSAETSVQASTPFKLSDILANVKAPLVITGSVFILILALVFHTTYFTGISWALSLLTFFKSVGLITSVLLLIQSIDSNNPLVRKLCQSGDKTNCNVILSSKAAKVFEGLTWSEVGFFYFAGTWLLLLFGGGTVAWQMLVLLNIISLPYTFYSIYYQARIAKQWCVLCCTVQALLWFKFIPLITAFHTPFMPPACKELSSMFIALLSPVVLWILLKPLLLQVQQLQPLKQQLQKFNIIQTCLKNYFLSNLNMLSQMLSGQLYWAMSKLKTSLLWLPTLIARRVPLHII
jgi:uncharacterized membrane protein